jgi:hypothetical protein
MFPGDAASAIVLKAATAPASLTSTQWAGVIAQGTVADFVANLGPVSAASQLFRAGLSVRFDGGTAPIPSLTSSAAGAAFVKEGEPIPVYQSTIAGVTLTPKKLGSISTFSGEMAKHSDIERIVREILTANVAQALDAQVFGTGAATDAAPAGLRNGVAGLTPATGGTADAMRRDVGALAGAVAAVAGSQIVFVASPDVAAKLLLTANPALPYPVLTSGALATGTLMAVAANAIAVAVDPVPSIDASTEGVLHYEDGTPLQIGTAGSPNTIAAPSRSLYQTDVIGLRVFLNVSWGLRASGAVAWVTSVTW